MIIETSRLLLLPLDDFFYERSLADDREASAAHLGATLDEAWFAERWLMELRLHDLRRDPELRPWLLRAVVRREDMRMIGHIGFHGRPGMPHLAEIAPLGVEVGYTIFPSYRRQGYAREALVGLLQWAETERQVQQFVASVSPENIPSLFLIHQLGFKKVGSHVDDVDGPEDVYLKIGAPAL